MHFSEIFQVYTVKMKKKKNKNKFSSETNPDNAKR